VESAARVAAHRAKMAAAWRLKAEEIMVAAETSIRAA
jgi:hypothetical protein